MEIEKIENLKLTADDFDAIDDSIIVVTNIVEREREEALVILHNEIELLAQEAFQLGLSHGDSTEAKTADMVSAIVKGIMETEIGPSMESLMKITPENSIPADKFVATNLTSGSVLNTESRTYCDFEIYPNLNSALDILNHLLIVKITYEHNPDFYVDRGSKIESVSEAYRIPVSVLKRNIKKSADDLLNKDVKNDKT